jgi:hypothetical protein
VSALDERHRERQKQLDDRVGATLTGLLLGLDRLDDDADLGAYAAAAYPVVAGGQDASALLATSYLALKLRTPAARVDSRAALAKTGVRVTPESRSLVAPVLRARKLVADGETEPVARESASAYARELASNDLQAAQRVGLDAGAKASGKRVRWRKDLSPSSCEWCRLVGADRTYSASDRVPYHPHDECGIVPVEEG